MPRSICNPLLWVITLTCLWWCCNAHCVGCDASEGYVCGADELCVLNTQSGAIDPFNDLPGPTEIVLTADILTSTCLVVFALLGAVVLCIYVAVLALTDPAGSRARVGTGVTAV